MFVSAFRLVFAALTLSLDGIVNGNRLSFDQVNTSEFTHKYTTHIQTDKARKSCAFPEPKSNGSGTLDSVIISWAVSFDLLLMSALGLSQL